MSYYNKIPVTWEQHENYIEHLLSLPDKYIWVDKLPQTGFTTSLGRVCLRKHLTFVEFAPVNRILIETVGGKIMDKQKEINSGIHPAYIFGFIGNNELLCPRSCKDELFDMYTTSCRECDIRGTDACYYNLVAKTDYPVYGITYDKFRIMESRKSPMGFMAKELREKIFNSNIILLDEFPKYIQYQPAGFFLKDALILKEYVNNRRHMLPVEQELIDDLNTFISGTDRVSQTLHNKDDKQDDPHSNEFRIYHNDEIVDSEGNLPALREVSKLGKSCLDIMETHKKDIGRIYKILGDKLASILQNIMASMTYREIYVIQLKEKKTGITMPYAFPNISHPFYSVMKPFLEEYKGKVIATGMILPPFDTLDWHKVFFPDFHNTQDKHLIVCDRKNAYYGGSAPDWYKDKEKTQSLILQIRQLHRDKIMVFAFNKDIYSELIEWRDGLVKYGKIKKKDIEIFLFLTYFRSDYTSGIEMDYRIKFFIGLPETPEEAYMMSEYLYNLSHDKTRDMEISDTAQNALGRGIDPTGRDICMTFIIGGTKERLLELIPEEKHQYYNIVQVFTEGSVFRTSAFYLMYWIQQKKKVIFRSQRGGEKNTKGISDETIDVQELPAFIDILRLIIDRHKKGVLLTRPDDIYRIWYGRGITATPTGISQIMKKFNKLIPTFIETVGRKGGWRVSGAKNDLHRWLLQPFDIEGN
jgi:hypothetical protein